jgi:hypothetical protein
VSKKESSKVASDQPGPEQPEQGSSVDEGKLVGEAQLKEAGQTPNPPKKLTLSNVLHELETLKQTVLHHTEQLADIESRLTRARKSTSPTSRTRVQIRDKQTGTVYRSQNATYRSLLKSGELKELVDKGVFGSVPEANSYGWFALWRAWPNRFVEVRSEQTEVGKGSEDGGGDGHEGDGNDHDGDDHDSNDDGDSGHDDKPYLCEGVPFIDMELVSEKTDECRSIGFFCNK